MTEKNPDKTTVIDQNSNPTNHTQHKIPFDQSNEDEQEQNAIEDQEDEKYDPYKIYQEDENGRITVPLTYPFKTNVRTFKEVHIRPSNGLDLRIAGKGEGTFGQNLILLQRCGEGLTLEAVNKMRTPDVNKCSEVVRFFSEE